MKRSKGKRIVSFILALMMAATMITCAYASTAEEKQSELDDINNEIDEKQGQIKANENLISDLSREIIDLDNRINDAQIRIDELTDSINDTKEKIVAKLAELEKKQEEVDKQDASRNARLRAMYKKGNAGMLSVILNSTSITDLLTNIEMSKKIYASDSNLLYKLKVEYEVIY